MDKTLKILALATLVIYSVSCRDIFEEDLEQSTIEIYSPADQSENFSLSQTFWWEELKDADSYHLQIVTPDFEQSQTLLLDSIVTVTQFIYTLSPGTYEWRVKGLNGSSETVYSTASFSILSDSVGDLSNQIMVLSSPSNNLITNELSITFKWDTITYANGYRFELASPDFNGTEVISPQILATDSFTHLFSNEGEYEWRVRASNDISVTTYSTRSIHIDTTAPNQPTLIAPAHNSITSDSIIVFTWDRGTVSGSDIFDSIFIYTDSIILSNIHSMSMASATNFSDSLSPNTYFWRVQSYDLAGNQSNPSSFNQLTVQ